MRRWLRGIVTGLNNRGRVSA